MDLEIVNPQPRYAKVTLVEPPPLGYLHVAAAVDPPRGRTPFPGKNPQKAALLTRLRSLARQLERLDTVERPPSTAPSWSRRPPAPPSSRRPTSPATTSSC